MTLCCWWCCHPSPTGEFLHMPFKQTRPRSFETLGDFCSWNCMKSYALEKYPQHKSGVICMYMTQMRKGARGDVIRCAPPRNALQCFGGTLSIEEFRSGSTRVACVMPDCVHKLHTVVEQNTKTTARLGEPNNTQKMSSIMNSQSNGGETLKLKRNKPLRREEQTNLETTLGIVTKQYPPLASSRA